MDHQHQHRKGSLDATGYPDEFAQQQQQQYQFPSMGYDGFRAENGYANGDADVSDKGMVSMSVSVSPPMMSASSSLEYALAPGPAGGNEVRSFGSLCRALRRMGWRLMV